MVNMKCKQFQIGRWCVIYMLVKYKENNGFKKYPHDRLGVGAVGRDMSVQGMARKENGWLSADGIHLGRSRPEPVTSIGAGSRQQPLWDQAKASNFCWHRYKGATSEGSGLSQ